MKWEVLCPSVSANNSEDTMGVAPVASYQFQALARLGTVNCEAYQHETGTKSPQMLKKPNSKAHDFKLVDEKNHGDGAGIFMPQPRKPIPPQTMIQIEMLLEGPPEDVRHSK